jgi:glycosyltransferase involved in cell wall biosynthesis
MKDKVLIMPFSASVLDGCDYALQTMIVLGKSNTVIGIELANPYSFRSFLHDFKNKKINLIRRHNNFYLLRIPYLIPGQRFKVIEKLNLRLGGTLVKHYLSRKYPKKTKLFWFFEPYQTLPLFKVFSNYFTVYDCVDYFVSASQTVAEAEDYLLRHADLVAVNSKTLHQIHAGKNKHMVRVAVGFPDQVFSKATTKATTKAKQQVTAKKKSSLVIGFAGAIHERIDFTLLIEVIKKLPQHQFLLVGPAQQGNEKVQQAVMALQQYANVSFLPNQPKDKMPGIINTFDVGLIPYDVAQSFNKYCYPMKLLDYFYMHKPVISTPIAELFYIDKGVLIGKTADEFVNHIRQLEYNPWPKQTAVFQREFALANTWTAKVNAICSEIEARLGKP